jgi:hypothetical protein
MGFQHDDKCLVSKELSSSKKQRIMKLALDLERQTKIQNRDYEAIEIITRDLHRIFEAKKELDLHLLKQSRFVPALFELLAKAPSLHKAEFSQLLRGLEVCTLLPS